MPLIASLTLAIWLKFISGGLNSKTLFVRALSNSSSAAAAAAAVVVPCSGRQNAGICVQGCLECKSLVGVN